MHIIQCLIAGLIVCTIGIAIFAIATKPNEDFDERDIY